MRAAFWHFYRFSRTHPEYFALMFVDHPVGETLFLGVNAQILERLRRR